jgi:ABC transporter substrate binding protein
LQQTTRTVPIVFVTVIDPVGAGYVESLARPGGNLTGGFSLFEYGLSGKWPELLKEVAPGVTRVAVIRDSTVAAELGLLGGIQSVASSLRVELSLIARFRIVSCCFVSREQRARNRRRKNSKGHVGTRLPYRRDQVWPLQA